MTAPSHYRDQKEESHNTAGLKSRANSFIAAMKEFKRVEITSYVSSNILLPTREDMTNVHNTDNNIILEKNHTNTTYHCDMSAQDSSNRKWNSVDH